jgi:hypothetical protein
MRSRRPAVACNDVFHQADGSTERQQSLRQAYGESDPAEDVSHILTGLRHVRGLDPVPFAGTAEQLAAPDLRHRPARHLVVAPSAATTSRNFAVSANCRKRAILPS